MVIRPFSFASLGCFLCATLAIKKLRERETTLEIAINLKQNELFELLRENINDAMGIKKVSEKKLKKESIQR